MANALKGKIAIVTGGSRGIGAATAIAFAKHGIQAIAISYVSNKKAADEVVATIGLYGAKAIAIQADLRDVNFGYKVVKAALDGFKVTGVDILVNNAALAETIPFPTVTDDDFARILEANLRGPIKAIQAVLPVINPGGRIINISSRAARAPMPGVFTLYASSKAALEIVTKGIATEYAAEKKITVNNVMPGPIETDALSLVPKEMLSYLASQATAEKRLGQPDDVAQVCVFLAQEGSRWVNGDTISVSGGMDML